MIFNILKEINLFNFLDIFSAFMVLFAVIDIIGSIPIIITLKEKSKDKKINAEKAITIATIIMITFLITGENLLSLFGVDISSFAIAGAIVIFALALEMVLGIELFKSEDTPDGGTVVPIAFPLIAGAGSITSLLALTAEYAMINVVIALLLNLLLAYVVLKATDFFEKLFGKGGILILRKVFGIILLAIAIKLFKNNIEFF
ncbi:MAG: hypothetical protein B6I24_09555 [Bacteroidetes bacterium 4572_128]|nr:MAG: hypothetical protein B6I24_09555 [Bacteroidetes bacterium 4572_128]